MRRFLKIRFNYLNAGQKDVLVAELAEIGFYAFEQDNEDLSAYIRENDYDEVTFKELLPPGAVYAIETITDKNWNQEWESNFHPVIVGDFAGIRASFHDSIKNVKHEIIVTPKMSFGTGHHATTYLMIEAMQQINFTNKTVLDFGTGTGILAILAEKSGASSILAIDNDEWSIRNAQENIMTNNCRRINVLHRDTIRGIPNVDIIAANINFNVLTEYAGDLAKALKDRSSLLLVSGIFKSDEEAIDQAFRTSGLIKKATNLKSDWISILFGKQ